MALARRSEQSLLLLTAILVAACSSGDDDNQTDGVGTGGSSVGTGGSVGTANTGGTSAVGTTGTGGVTPTGGSHTGGQATGGVSTGGVSTGGVHTGGVHTGGVHTGGVHTGGVHTGGVSTGGVSTGGVSTGGVSTGGVSTGGAATGGASTGDSGGASTGDSGGASTGDSGGASTGDSGGASTGDSGGASTGGVATGGTDDTGDVGGGAGDAGTAGTGGGGEDVGQSAGCGKTRTLTNGRKTIQSGGSREYILRVPDNYDNNKPYRLIIAYHWLNGNANQVAEGGNGGSTEDPYYGLWDLADDSTIFVAPEGLPSFQGLGWDNTDGRDLALTDAILDEIQGDLCIDTTRIFATGFSFGAGMSYAVACARADVFRGVVLYAGAQLSGCDGGTTPIAYMHVHGNTDTTLDISGGRSMRDHYVEVNGCTPQNPPEPGGNSGTHICTSYEGCSEGHPVRWCAHGGGHNPTEKDSGQAKSWVPGEAWTFISQF